MADTVRNLDAPLSTLDEHARSVLRAQRYPVTARLRWKYKKYNTWQHLRSVIVDLRPSPYNG